MTDDPLHAAERLGAKRTERQLTDLRASNQRREEALHQRQMCTEPSLPALRLQAFLDVAVDRLDCRPDFELAVEQLRAQGYDQVEADLENRERAKREATLLGVAQPR